MSNKLILYNGPTSPFGRKVKVASLIQEINIEEKIINVYEANFLDKHNFKDIWEEIRYSTNSKKQFILFFNQWFDALKVIKLLKELS